GLDAELGHRAEEGRTRIENGGSRMEDRRWRIEDGGSPSVCGSFSAGNVILDRAFRSFLFRCSILAPRSSLFFRSSILFLRSSFFPQLGNNLGQSLAVDELHGIVVDAAVAADGVNRDNMWMLQTRGSKGFVLEVMQLLGIQG